MKVEVLDSRKKYISSIRFRRLWFDTGRKISWQYWRIRKV